MNSFSPAQALAPRFNDRLARLVEFWRNRPSGPPASTPPEQFDALRNGLNALADEAEASDQNRLARALRRVALLGEIWECLEGDPDQADAVSEMAAFCIEAIDRLTHDPRASRGGEPSVYEEILRQSAERWGDYLNSVDPTSTDATVEAEPESFEDQGIPEDDAPPELDPATLLRLLQGAGAASTQPAKSKQPPEEPHNLEACKAPPARAERHPEADRSSRISAQATVPTSAAARDERGPAWIELPSERGLTIPPLPARIDLDDELREAFLADATELFERIESLVLGLSGPGDHREAIHELKRCFHTLKGAAGSVGLSDLATLVHELEERLGAVGGVISTGLNDLLHQVVNYLEGLICCLQLGTGSPAAAAPVYPASPIQSTPAPPPIPSVPAAAVPPAPRIAVSPRTEAPAAAPSRAATPVPAAEGPIRVPAARFDELTDLASELIVQGRFWLSQAETMKTFATSVQDCRGRLLASLDRLHDVGVWEKGQRSAATSADMADYPVQLCRLEEQVADLAVLAASAHAVSAPMADRGDALVRLSRRIWDSFQSLRIVPIQGLFQRLARVIHDAARVEGRQVEVVMKGEETGVDRAVQDRAFEPLLHVARNAVGHGIESPEDRLRAGKPAAGRVTLEARREGNTLLIVVTDDGKGLDDQAIAAKARQLGWLGPDEKASPERLHGFLFQPGFSTKAQANAISGRGVGMDVVAREIDNLRGTLALASQLGRGTQLTIRLPARLALEPALIVRVAGQPFAIPASQVEHAQLFEPSVPYSNAPWDGDDAPQRGNSGNDASVTYRDEALPVVFAREMLGIGLSSPTPWSKLVIVRAGNRPIGLVVDTIERAEDLVIKPLGTLLAGHPLVSGTSTSISGEVISVLHSSGLERWLLYRMTSAAHSIAHPEQAPFPVTPEERLAVLVVDDSISVRRGLARQLRGLGLEVHEVSDGLEALGRLRDCHFGLVVTDLEMPKLDGFALLAEIKRSSRLATIPVIVASTRCDTETRRRVQELGAEAMLSKPVDPLELVRVLEPLLPAVRG